MNFFRSFNANTMWSIAGGGVPALTALGSIPVLVHLLGVELFALVSLLLSLNLFFFVYDFGLTRTMHFFLPKGEFQAKEKSGILIGNSLLLAAIIGVVVTLIVMALSSGFVLNWLKLTGQQASEVELAFQISALGIIPALMSNVIKGVFEGKVEFKRANMAKMFSGASLFSIPVIVATWSDSLVSISFSIVLSRCASICLYGYFLFKLIQPSYILFSTSLFKSIITYAFWAGIAGFFATLFIYGDRFIVAGYVNAAELAIYIASQDVLIRYMLIPWSIAIVLSPYFASEQKEKGQFKRSYFKAMNNIVRLTLCFVVMVVIGIKFIMPVWLDANFVLLGRQINFILLVGIIFAALSQLPLVFLYAQGKAKLLTAIFVIEGGAYLLFAPIIFDFFGIYGAAFLWSVRLMIEFILLNYFSLRVLQND